MFYLATQAQPYKENFIGIQSLKNLATGQHKVWKKREKIACIIANSQGIVCASS